MKKRGIAVIIAAGLVACTAFAGEAIDEVISDAEIFFDFQDAPNALENEVESHFEDDIFVENGEETEMEFDADSEWKGDSETVGILSALSVAVDAAEKPEKRLEIIREVASFEEEYNMAPDTRAQFGQWIAEGRDYRLLMYIYEFWTTTNEDISIIVDIYDMFTRNYYEGMRLPDNKTMWFEGIFNTLTDNKCGTIESDDIDHYMEAGLDLYDIKLAERVSRAGIKQVHEILDDRATGISWVEIAAEIYNMPELLSYPEMDLMTLQGVLTLSRITGDNAEVILAKTESTTVWDILEQHMYESRRKADNAIISAGLWEFDSPEEEAMVMKAVSGGTEPVKALINIKQEAE